MMTLEGFAREQFAWGGKVRDIYRAGSGPAVIVIAEIPGITPPVAAFARRVASMGCTAVLPHLFGDPGRSESPGAYAKVLGVLCVSSEFSRFALNKASPVTAWLRALAADEHRRCGGPGVGVVGMCFTGGFALAMMVDDIVVAPVLSQPSLPYPLTRRHRADIGISGADLEKVKARVASGTCVMGLRFTGDRMCPGDRFDTLRRELGDGFIAIELDSSLANPFGHPRNAHSVLTRHLDDRDGTPTHDALGKVLHFLRSQLQVPEPAP